MDTLSRRRRVRQETNNRETEFSPERPGFHTEIEKTQSLEQSKPEPVDLDAFYQSELLRLQELQSDNTENVWEKLREIAKSKRERFRADRALPIKEAGEQKLTLKDKLHRKALRLQARLEGIDNLQVFDELVGYLEANMEDKEVKHLKAPKGASDEQKEAIIEKWRAKGWEDWGSRFGMRIERRIPLRLRRQDVKSLKQLFSEHNNPVELFRTLHELGFSREPWTFRYSAPMEQLSKLFSAPGAQNVLQMAKSMGTWSHSWFNRDYGENQEGQITFFSELAQSANPERFISGDTAGKINTLAAALDVMLDAQKVKELQSIAQNPYYTQGIILLTKGYSSFYDSSIVQTLSELDKQGILRPLVDLERTGVSLDPSAYGVISRTDASKLEGIKQQLEASEVKSFLKNSGAQEFTKLLTQIKGSPVRADALGNLEKWFGRNLEHKEKALYVAKLLNDMSVKRELNLYSNTDLEYLGQVVSREGLMPVFTDKKFAAFLQDLKDKAGYRLAKYDFYDDGQSRLATAFAKTDVRRGLLRPATIEVVKALHLNGALNFYNVEYYISLGEIPNSARGILALRSLGFNFGRHESSPKLETITEIATSDEKLGLLESEEMQELASRLKADLGWEPITYEIAELIAIAQNTDLKKEVFLPENLEFLKKARPNGVKLRDFKDLLRFNAGQRDLVIELVEKLGYRPYSFKPESQEQILERLAADDQLYHKIFSEEQLALYKRFKKAALFSFDTRDLDIVANLSEETVSFIELLVKEYRYEFTREGYEILTELAVEPAEFLKALETVRKHGYEFKSNDFLALSRLKPVANELDSFLTLLNEILGYSFDIKDASYLTSSAKRDFSQEELKHLENVYNQYAGQYQPKFGPAWIEPVELLAENRSAITELERYGYKFKLNDLASLTPFLKMKDKSLFFELLEVFKEHSLFSFKPDFAGIYMELVSIDGAVEALVGVKKLVGKGEFMSESNLKLFTVLGGNTKLYKHARDLLTDDYFTKVRDAQKRIGKFMKSVLSKEMPKELVEKMFALSKKATDLDNLGLQTAINSEIAVQVGNDDWYKKLLESGDLKTAKEILTRGMIELAIPALYTDLDKKSQAEKFDHIQREAADRPDFMEMLNVCCRSVGIYAKKYPNKGEGFEALMTAIRQTLEMNLEAQGRVYLEKRAELSNFQFDNIFAYFTPETRAKVMKFWLDLSPSRRLRVSGDKITAEETTMARLQTVKDIVQIDLSVHLRRLLSRKMGVLTEDSQLFQVFKEQLLTQDGELRPNSDLVKVYASVERFIRSAREKLKSAETPREEKAKIGRSLAVYQSISSLSKALYKLAGITETKYKERRNYPEEINSYVGEFSTALKRLNIADSEQRSADVDIRALEEEVLLDLEKLKSVMEEENIVGQTTFETHTTVNFADLARAPEMTMSCQRLTEATDYNQAAYSRLLDGNNEMVDVFELQEGGKNRLARTFVELSMIKVEGSENPQLTVLMDRAYFNPQYQSFSNHFNREMVLHLIDRLEDTSEVSLLFAGSKVSLSKELVGSLEKKGYRVRQVSGEYFVNESMGKLIKYYDSLGGLTNVNASHWVEFGPFFIAEKV